MRIQGHDLSGPAVEIIPIPRDDGDIIFKAQAVLDYGPFDEMVPRPEPPIRTHAKSGRKEILVDDPDFVQKLTDYARLKQKYMFIMSLQATEGLEWDEIKINDPETWDKFDSELEGAGFNMAEISYIILGIHRANGLDEERMDEARERFLADQKQESD